MSANSFSRKIKSLPTADRWLLGLCVLPLIFFALMLYDAAAFLWQGARGGASEWMLSQILYPLIALILVGSAVLVPLTAALRRSGPLPRILIWLCALGILNHFAGAINYIHLVNWLPLEGFRWTSEIHVVLRFFSIDVPEGTWIGIVLLVLWLAIAVLFVRKCRLLKRAEQRLQPVTA